MQVEDKKTILLVEDEAILAMSEKMSLEQYGYSVITVTTGEMAIEAVKSTPEINLILMDINLGEGLDGTQAAEIILKERDIPILFLSSHMEPDIVEKTERITSYGYVVKSSSITVLDASIKMAFKLFRAHNEINQQNTLIKAGNEKLNLTVAELETSRNRLTSVFRAAPTGIGVIINRTIAEVNQRICEMTGYQEDELIGKNSKILYPKQEDYDFVGREKYAKIKLKGTGTVETRWICKDGKIIDVLLSSTPLDIYDLGKGVTFTALNITNRKGVEKVLQESEEKFSKIFQGSSYPIMIIDTENGCFTEVNQSMIHELEYSREELIGRNAVELGILKPDIVLQTKKLITESGQFSNLEIAVKTKSGKPRSALATGQLVVINKHTYLIQTIMDITNYKQAEKALRESEETLSFVMDGVPALLAYLDADLRFVFLNKAHVEWYGLEKEDIIGKTLKDLLSEQAYNRALPNYLKVLKGEIVTFENKNHDDKGIERHVSVRLLPHFMEGKVNGFFASLNDITNHKLAEEEIKKQLTEKETLLKEVHHRIKNNISSIENLLLMQLRSISNPEAVSALQDAISRVQGMRILYDKLLIGKDYKEVSVKAYTEQLINAIVTVFPESEKVIIKKQIVDFNLNVNSIIPLGIIINELLTNTLKYAFKEEEGGQISINLDKTDNHVAVTIKDNGNGIDENFDLNKSTGFGLKIVKILTKQLGGTFTIENYNGTRSIIKFPI